MWRKEVGTGDSEASLAGCQVDEISSGNLTPAAELAASKVHKDLLGGEQPGHHWAGVWYDDILSIDGKILTTTDARGVEIPDELGKAIVEPVAGYDLHIPAWIKYPRCMCTA